VRAWGALSEALLLLVFVRIGLRITRYSRLRGWLGRVARVRTGTPSSVAEVTWAVGVAGRRISGTTCLAEALAADTMLRRRGYASEIRFGVRPPSGGALAAHAWVEHEGAVVFGAREEHSEYSVLSTRGAK
jgi:hypothetical protein